MMKKLIALLLVLSLLSVLQPGAAAVSAEGREAVLPALPAAAVRDAGENAGECADPMTPSMTTELRRMGENPKQSDSGELPAMDQLRITGLREYDNAYAVLDLVNARRAENGLPPLVMDQDLLSAAMGRAGECALFFSHTRPDGSICFFASPKMAGENIAAGYGTPDAVMNGWMNSPGHRGNILNAGFHSIGIGCIRINSTRFWVQCFGRNSPEADCAQPANASVQQTINVCPDALAVDGGSSGNGEYYEIKLNVTADRTVLNMGEGTSLHVNVQNPTFPSFHCPIDPDGLSWASSDAEVASAYPGAVYTSGAGMIEITASGPQHVLTGTVMLDVQSPACSGGHVLDDGVMTEPTCTEPGYFRQRCKVCKMKMAEQQYCPSLGHCWSFQQTLREGENLHACTGLYACSRCWQSKQAPLCAAEVFTDMPEEGHWAHNAIDWAYFSGLTSGTTPTTFSPDATLTRGQVVTFLYALRGKPETAAANPFADISETDYFYKPVLWAVENGITRGMDETHFAPADSCVRAQIVTFLWATAGRPEPAGTANPFEDVSESDYFYKPVLWAVENGITRGVDATHFAPAQTCTRAQMVTFLKALVFALYG